MTNVNVKVTVAGKNGNDYEALVPITTACRVLFNGVANTTNITKMGYSVVHQCHNFIYGNAKSASKRAQLNLEIKPLFSAMECTNNIIFTNGVVLFKD